MRQQGARSRHQQSNKRMSWKAADVRKECTCDRAFWTSTDVLQDAQVVLESGSTQRSAEQGSCAGNESLLAGCIAAVNKLLCDTPTVDLSRDRTALSGKFPEDDLKAGRELELGNMLNFDAFDRGGGVASKKARL